MSLSQLLHYTATAQIPRRCRSGRRSGSVSRLGYSPRGSFCGSAHRTLCGSCRLGQSSDSPGPSLLFCFFSFQGPHFLHRSRVRPTSGSRARVRFPLAFGGGSQGSRFGRVRSEKLLTEKSPLLMAMSNEKHYTCMHTQGTQTSTKVYRVNQG